MILYILVEASFWKKKTQTREIISGAFLRSQERLQSIQTLRNTILRAQEHFQSPSELRASCIWSWNHWFWWIFIEIPIDPTTVNALVFDHISLNFALDLQWNLARSSRGVGWANGDWGIVTGTSATRSARFRGPRSTPDTISRACFFFKWSFDYTHLLKSSDVKMTLFY